MMFSSRSSHIKITNTAVCTAIRQPQVPSGQLCIAEGPRQLWQCGFGGHGHTLGSTHAQTQSDFFMLGVRPAKLALGVLWSTLCFKHMHSAIAFGGHAHVPLLPPW